MENSCKVVWEEQFQKMGYPSNEGCMVCGGKPARLIDTWFNLTVCIDHSDWNPQRIQQYLKDKALT